MERHGRLRMRRNFILCMCVCGACKKQSKIQIIYHQLNRLDDDIPVEDSERLLVDDDTLSFRPNALYMASFQRCALPNMSLK